MRSSGKDDYSAETFPKRYARSTGNYPYARANSALEGLVKISNGKRFREDEDFFEWIREGVLERSGVKL